MAEFSTNSCSMPKSITMPSDRRSELRWSKQTGRWTVSSEGRFTAGVNFQQACVQGHYGTKDPNDWRFEALGTSTAIPIPQCDRQLRAPLVYQFAQRRDVRANRRTPAQRPLPVDQGLLAEDGLHRHRGRRHGPRNTADRLHASRHHAPWRPQERSLHHQRLRLRFRDESVEQGSVGRASAASAHTSMFRASYAPPPASATLPARPKGDAAADFPMRSSSSSASASLNNLSFKSRPLNISRQLCATSFSVSNSSILWKDRILRHPSLILLRPGVLQATVALARV